jgi:hypothetical protein
MDMLKNAIKFLLPFIFVLLINSCGSNTSTPVKSNSYISSNFNSYKDVYGILNDSIKTYVDSLVGTFTPEYMYGWVVDSMICINSSNDKLFAITIEQPRAGTGFLSDDAMELLGKKINGKWYFFSARGSLVIPRDMYGYSETKQPSQYFLSQIARKQMMESTLVKKDGEYVVSDEWIDQKFYNNGWGVFKTHAEYDSVHWVMITRKWKEKIDTNEYKPLRKYKEEKPTI